ncbi:MAG: 3-oxoadipate enol-lactonase [Janthinobacterium lividum]
MAFATINGIQLYYRIDARPGVDAHAPWLVLSNSLGSDVSMWSPQIDAFASRFRVLRYDTRGHGRSDAPAGPYTIDQLAGDVVGLLDALDIDRAHFCGVSMGGLTGIALAARFPGRFGKFVLANTAALIGTAATWTPRAAQARAAGMDSLTDAVIARWFTPAFFTAAPLFAGHVRDVLRHTSGEGYAANCEAIRDADLRDAARTIDAPVLVIAGTHDQSTPPAQGRELAAAIAHARYVELDAAHLSNIEKADEFTDAVSNFLGAPA